MKFSKNIIFGKYLVVTNTISCGLIMGFGDALQQIKENWKRNNNCYLQTAINNQMSNNLISNKTINLSVDLLENDSNQFSKIRTRNMIVIGTLQGPFNHYFYASLEKLIPGKGPTCLIKKTIIDQMIGSPTCLAIFFFGHEMLEDKNSRQNFDEVINNLLKTYKVDCVFWPPIQLINFLFIPIQYRVIYINLLNLFYNIFLSYTKYDAS